MLERLIIKNFAIIEDIDINFKEGFNVLSGETGAGKSLIIDALEIVLGERAQANLIRYGTNEAKILASFSNLSSKAIELLGKNKIKYDNVLEIERIISKEKSSIKINGVHSNLSLLKTLGSMLVNFHNQNDNFKLLNKENYISFIDQASNLVVSNLINDYLDKRQIYLDDYKALEDAIKRKKETIEKEEYYKYVLKELNELELTPDLYNDLDEEIKRLSNFDKIYECIKTSLEKLDNEYFNIDTIYSAINSISKIENYDSNLKEINNNLNSGYELLSKALEELKVYISNFEYDPDYLNNLILKQNKIDNVMLKYHKNYSELLEFKTFILEELKISENYDSYIKEYETKLKNSFNALLEKALILSKYRTEFALKLEDELINECADLELKNMQFKIIFNQVDYSNYLNKDIFKTDGIDDIDFLISLNLGEPLLNLADVVSGGEMSRLSLAFKSILSKNTKYSLFIFDEIDTGMSGRVLYKIAEKIKKISESVQTIVISHMAQVEAKADNVIFIYKETLNDRTITKVKSLNDLERVEELARMISGGEVSDHAVLQAKEMIEK